MPLNPTRPQPIKRYLPAAMMTAGFVLLAYVGLQYFTMYAEQHRLAKEWETQQERPVAAQPQEAAGDGLTRISIPKINLTAVVVEGTSRHQLLLGPGHLERTAAPGESGNAVITGHRDTFFRHIYELEKGDEIEVQRDGKVFHYRVTGKRVVEPDDMTVVRPSKDAELTLITCYPTYYIGPAPERLVVFSKLVTSQSDQNRLSQNSSAATAGSQ